jgi:hypothetical protein
MKVDDFPAKVLRPWGWRADPGYIRPIPSASQIGVLDGAASWADGWPPKTMEPIAFGGFPPHGADHNGVLNNLSGHIRVGHFLTPLPFDPAFQTEIDGYPRGSLVLSSNIPGLVWESQIDDNLTDPDAGGAGWSVRTFVDPGTGGLIIEGEDDAGIQLRNGGLTPAKWITARDGALVVLNNARQPILTLADDGTLDLINALRGTTATFSGLITGGSLTTGSGTISGGAISGASLAVTGNVQAGANVNGQNVTAASTVTGAQLTSSANINASGQITGNVIVGNQITSNANINAANAIDATNRVDSNYLYSRGNIDAAGVITAHGNRLRATAGLATGDANAALLVMDLAAILAMVPSSTIQAGTGWVRFPGGQTIQWGLVRHDGIVPISGCTPAGSVTDSTGQTWSGVWRITLPRAMTVQSVTCGSGTAPAGHSVLVISDGSAGYYSGPGGSGQGAHAWWIAAGTS